MRLNKKNWKSVLKILIINFVIFFILLIIIDPFLGKLQYTNPSQIRSILLREHPPLTDNYYKPPTKYQETTQNLELKEYRLRTNSNGFIIGDDTGLENKDSIDVIFFGGSTTECQFMEEHQRFPYLVGQKMLTNSGRMVNSLNAGRAGNNSMHATLKLLAKGVPLRPKVVVLMNNINDLSTLAIAKSYWNLPKSRSIIQIQNTSFFSQIRSTSKAILKQLFPNIIEKIKSIQVTKMNINQDEWDGYSKTNFKGYKDIEKAFDQSLTLFIRTAQIYNIEVVLMTQANRLNKEDPFIKRLHTMAQEVFDSKTYSIYYKQLNQKIREIAERENILLIDLDQKVPPIQEFIYDQIHFNSQGSQLVSDIISEELSKYFPFFHLVDNK